MSVGSILHLLGRLCLVFAGLLLVPLLVVVIDGTWGSAVTSAFLVAAGTSAAVGLGLLLSFQMDYDAFDAEEAFVVVAASWVVFTVLGGVPYVLAGAVPSLVDAGFESLSGFTTTGASIVPDPATLGRPLLLWRALTHWVGGMGVVMLSVAVLPALGAGGSLLLRAEASGSVKTKLMPRISDVARLLWGIYLGLTVAGVVALWLAGMSPFDAICHTFATVATGGFGTRADSLASFSPLVQWVVIVLMVLSGTNYVLLLSVFLGRPAELLRNTEVRAWLLILLVASVVGVFVLAPASTQGVDEQLIRGVVFSVVSVSSTTGFGTVDFALWPMSLHVMLLLLLTAGACTGTTCGSAKVFRHIVWAKAAWRELQRLLRPNGVFVVRVDGQAVPETTVAQGFSFLIFYLGTVCLGTLLLALAGLGGIESISSVMTCLAGCGPGLGSVGPTSNYAALPDAAKLLLMLCMLLGRLEYFALLVLLSPLAWRR